MNLHVLILLVLVCSISTIAQTQNKMFRDTKYSYSLMYPSDWVPAESSSINTRFKIASDSVLGFADFSVIVTTPPEIKGMTSAEFANGIAKRPDIVKAMVNTGLPGATILSSGKTYLSNREAFFVKFTGNLRQLDESLDMTMFQIITVFEDKSITLTCRALTPVFDTYFDTCKEMASSFVLLPTKIHFPTKKKGQRIKNEN
jgi:hypothetical protein